MITYLHLVPRLECMELYLRSPTRLHGVVLNYKQGKLYFYNYGLSFSSQLLASGYDYHNVLY